MKALTFLSILAICGFSFGAVIQNNVANSSDEFLKPLSLFSAELLQSVSKYHPGENIFCSPLSLYSALAMLIEGANGNTLQQSLKSLHMTPEELQNKADYSKIIGQLKNIRSAEFSVANKIFVNDGFPINASFVKRLEIFKSKIQSVNFKDSKTAAIVINNWAKQSTNGLIDNLVNADTLEKDTKLMLLNAIYFKGIWEVLFDPKMTKRMPFIVNNTFTSNVDYMVNRDLNCQYGDITQLNASFVEIPYKNGEFHMLVILPWSTENLEKVQEGLKSFTISEILSDAVNSSISITLPKFKLSSKIDMKPILEDMGMIDMFSENANFEKMSGIKTFVNKVIQRSFIEVNEVGTKAAVVTEVDMNDRFGDREVFVANRPFIMIIHSKGIPVFIARVNNPAQ